jgi:hypothetical protein
MSRPGFEPGPPAREASTLEKSHLDSLSAGYSEPLLSRHLLTTFGPLQYLLVDAQNLPYGQANAQEVTKCCLCFISDIYNSVNVSGAS